MTVLCLLLGSVGGLSVLLAVVGFAQVRVWNRLVVIIAFFAMITVLAWAERGVDWVRARSTRPRVALGVVAVVVLAFGLWDGTPARHQPYAVLEARRANDRTFVGQIEELMPTGSRILQLPIIRFPESAPRGGMVDYDHLRGYLADDGTLRWSYGAIKGRPDEAWQEVLSQGGSVVPALPALLGLGFSGIWIDTQGYRDLPDPAAEILAIEQAVGRRLHTSPDGRVHVFDHRPYRASLGLSDQALRQAAKRGLNVDAPGG